jgi:glycosyltransferase involved in cell wall biosynthesis
MVAGSDILIYAVLPTGSFHGWGVCGKYIVRELAKRSTVRLFTDDLSFANIQDEFDYRMLRSVLIGDDEKSAIRSGRLTSVSGPVLQNIVDKTLRPAVPGFRGSFTAGYTFFEDNILSPESIENGRRHYDTVVTGSSWCEQVLRRHGLQNVTTIIQGIDPTIFNLTHADKEYLPESFVIFSGGKFELRKGQDLVMRAVKVMQDRYPDVVLVNSWYNHWPASMQTMAASPYVRFSPDSGDYSRVMQKVLGDNGLDLNRVIILPPYPNVMMTRIYRNSDIGIFPNRCEGGTNLVMMEYMACGKPVIASYSSGHRDVLTTSNSLPLMRLRPLSIADATGPIAVWDDPDLDELIAQLDWAYHHREQITHLGHQAGIDLAGITWQKTGQAFSQLLIGNKGRVPEPVRGTAQQYAGS